MTTNVFRRVSLRRILAPVVLVTALAAVATPASADGEINTGYFGRVAIKGYDPVAYFTEAQAVQGTEEHSVEWLGAIWHFTTAENKQLFAAEPLRYAPQYGGYCAVGMASGTLTNDIDPEAWDIIEGKLYLNYSKTVTSHLNPDTISAADGHWSRIRAAAPSASSREELTASPRSILASPD